MKSVLILTALTITILAFAESPSPLIQMVAGTSVPHYRVFVYHDTRYSGSWFGTIDASFLSNYLLYVLGKQNLSVSLVNADSMVQVMTDLADANGTVVVMSQDVVPNTVWNGSTNSLVGDWINAGGTLVYTGDYPFYDIGYPNGTKATVPTAEFNVVGRRIIASLDSGARMSRIGNASNILPSFNGTFTSYRPINGSLLSGMKWEGFASATISGRTYYDPAMVKIGSGWLAIAMLAYGPTSTRAMLVAEFVLNRLLNQGVKLIGPKIQFPKTVLAYYFQWFPSHWYLYGHDGSTLPNGLQNVAAAFNPQIGAYSSDDLAATEYHVRLAKSAGINVLALDWYGQSDSSCCMSTLLGVAQSYGLKVTVELEPKLAFPPWPGAPSSRGESIAMVEQMLLQVLGFSGSPAFFKMNGRPVITVYSATLLTPDEWGSVMSYVQKQGYDPMMAGDIYTADYIPFFDIAIPWIQLGYNNATIGSKLSGLYSFYGNYTQLYPDKTYWPLVWPGFNDSGVYGWGGGSRYEAYGGMTFYQATWEAAFQTSPTGVQIGTWNDWNEGTQIEPSVQKRYSYLNLTHDFAEKFKGISLGPPNSNATDELGSYGLPTGTQLTTNATIVSVKGSPSWVRIVLQNPGTASSFVLFSAPRTFVLNNLNVTLDSLKIRYNLNESSATIRLSLVIPKSPEYDQHVLVINATAASSTTTSTTSAKSISTVSTVTSTTTETTTTITPSTSTTASATTVSTTFPTVSVTTPSATTTPTATASTSSGGGGIPEFPYQLVVTTVLTFLVVASYLLVRRSELHSSPREATDARQVRPLPRIIIRSVRFLLHGGA